MSWNCQILPDNSVEIYYGSNIYSFNQAKTNLSKEQNVIKSIQHITDFVNNLLQSENYDIKDILKMITYSTKQLSLSLEK